MKKEYDVIIIGGGTAGVPAAVQSARAGADTLLVEKCGQLGGTITVAGVDAPALFHAWDRQVVAGIGWEMMEKLVPEGGAVLPDVSSGGPWQNSNSVKINIPLFSALADRMVKESGCELLLHAMLAEAACADDGWQITLCTKRGLSRVKCRVLVDCTGDADAVRIAGFKVRTHPSRQPGTLSFRMGGYDMDSLDTGSIQEAYEKACREGTLLRSDSGWHGGKIAAVLKKRGINSIHVCGIDGSDSESKTAAEVKARETMRRLYLFLRKNKGLENLVIEEVSQECGIRETVTIIGKKTVTLEDYTSGRVWDDAVCCSFYPIDLHTDEGLDFRKLPEGAVPTIPRGAMLPEGSSFLIAAGRHISGDRLANAAYRVQATCMAMGQAAGAMAALSAKNGCDPEQLDVGSIRDLLRKHGAIVP